MNEDSIQDHQIFRTRANGHRDMRCATTAVMSF